MAVALTEADKRLILEQDSPESAEQLASLWERLQKGLDAVLLLMGGLNSDKETDFKWARLAWGSAKQAIKVFDRLQCVYSQQSRLESQLAAIYADPDFRNFQKVRLQIYHQTPKWKEYKAKWDKSRAQDTSWKMDHAAKMREHRAKKRDQCSPYNGLLDCDPSAERDPSLMLNGRIDHA